MKEVNCHSTNMEKETIFADGLYVNKKHENAPDFVKGSLGIEVDRFIAFLQQHKNEDGRVSIDLLAKKDGSGTYGTLNTWKPEKKEDTVNPPAEVDSPF